MKLLVCLILLVLMSNSLFADNKEKNCIEKVDVPLKGLPNIDFLGADTKDIRRSVCRNTEKITSEEIEAYFKNKYPGVEGKSEFLNFKLINENPQMVEYLKRLTVIPTDTSSVCYVCKDFKNQKIYKIPATCTDVICSAKAAFGKDQGLRMLYLMDRYGINTSSDIFKRSSRWKVKELDEIIKAFGDFPSFMAPLETNKKFTHFYRKKRPSREDLSHIGDATIQFYDGYDRMSPEGKHYAILHEWGHGIATGFEIDKNKKWLDLSGWEDRNGVWKATRPHSCVSQYAATKPSEDFAESVATYRYNPNLLKTLNPEKYNFMKEVVFQGIEYLDSNKCGDENSYVSKIAANTEKIFSPSGKLSDYSKCKKEFFGILSLSKNLNDVDSCLQKVVATQKIEAGYNQDLNLSYGDFAKKGVEVYQFNLSQLNLGQEKLLKMKEELKQKFASSIAEGFMATCKRKKKSEKIWTLGFLNSQATRCNNLSLHSYQDSTKINEVFSDQFFIINNRDNYENFIKRVCLSLGNKELNSCDGNKEYLIKKVFQNFSE